MKLFVAFFALACAAALSHLEPKATEDQLAALALVGGRWLGFRFTISFRWLVIDSYRKVEGCAVNFGVFLRHCLLKV